VPGGLDLRAVNRLVQSRAWRQFQFLFPEIASREVDAIVGWPPAVDLATRFQTRTVTYDCLDLYPEFFKGTRQRTMTTLETELASRATGIVVTSRRLQEQWTKRHRRVALIPNGVDLERFADNSVLPARELDLYPQPRLGYIGTVGRWLDLELLAELARLRPSWSVLLVGPLERGVDRVPRRPNLHLLGVRPYASLPAILAGLDVLLIPFKITKLTQAVNPIKLYEYCATGKPIVATPLEEVLAHDGVCLVGDGPTAFLDAVEAALAEAAAVNPSHASARQALARASTWEKRVADLVQFIDRPA
jgi:glycosyltransferase involved in cell wall biosynthesis